MEEEIIGIAPFFLDVRSFRNRCLYRCLRLLGSDVFLREDSGKFFTYDPSDYLDVISKRGYTHVVVRKLLEYLSECHDLFDQVDLPNVHENSIIMNVLVPNSPAFGFRYTASRQSVCPRLAVASSI